MNILSISLGAAFGGTLFVLSGCTQLPAKDDLVDPDGDGSLYGEDCDNDDPTVHPGAAEVYYDGADNDCDPTTDDLDADADGYAAVGAGGTDCDDANPAINPVASDSVDGSGTDQNCDGVDGTDGDGDGYASDVTGGEDCDDDEATVSPEGTEACDEIDNDCDEMTDEDDAIDASTWYADADGDGFGDVGTTTQACTQPVGYVVDSEDCDDEHDTAHPDGTESPYNGLDDDCDPSTPDDDLDGDGYNALVAGGEDCDDGEAAVSPDGTEVCDEIDNDCDEMTDEDDAIDASTWYADADGDGFGDATTTTQACTQPVGYVVDSEDCDDEHDTANPDRTESPYNRLDDDCDPSTPDDDLDGDGYNAEKTGGEDCDDGAASVYPGAAELCDDDVVNDCDDDTVSALAACGLGGTLTLADADLKMVGESTDDVAGYSVSGAGDVDGDGLADILIGAYQESTVGTYAGAAYLLLGSSILASGSSPLDLSDAYLKLLGESSGDNAGIAVSVPGDLNGDGFDEMLIGAGGHDGGAADGGAAYILRGSGTLASGTLSLSDANLTFTAESAKDDAGTAVSGAGDVDDDGYGDVLIGAYEEDSGGDEAGAAYLLYGAGALASATTSLSLSVADLTLTGETTGDNAGLGVSSAGDFDDDGLGDVLVGAWYEGTGGVKAGAAYLLLGGGALDTDASSLDLSGADLKLTGEADYDRAARPVAGAGDVDGDGFDDILIDAWYEGTGDAGAVYVVFGGALAAESSTRSLSDADMKLTGESDEDNAGRAASWAGDVDGDGLSDILVGAYKEDAGASNGGSAYLLLGGGALASGSFLLSLSSSDLKLTGEATNDYAGVAVSGAGDVDGDGFDDLLVGAHGEDSGGANAGAVYLIYGGGY